MITVVCDTIEEKERVIESFDRSDICLFGDNPCGFNFSCPECMSKRIEFIVKENKDE